jgi:hypothetical protein
MRRFLKESLLAFTVSSLMLPGAIAVATVLLVLTGPGAKGSFRWSTALNRTPPRICFYGALIGFGFCVLLAIFACRRFTRAESACPEPYDQLHQRFDGLKTRVEVVCTGDPCPPDAPQQADWREAARREALEHNAYLERRFRRPSPVGLPWLLATGYIDTWRRVHAIEQSLLVLEPVPRLVSEALDDETRLDGSNIPQSSALIKRLRVAVAGLDAAAVPYLIEAPPLPESSDEAAARAALVQVRGAISEFRDSRREALVRARNRLFGTVIFAGTTACVLLFVAVLAGAPRSSIEAVSAFYLVGAIVGLVRQLQLAATATASQADYGLGVVRLVQIPLFSGLAAVGGVVLVKLAQGQGTTGAAAFSLSETFDLGANPYGLVAAAIFGLTPALLFSGLQRRAEQYRTDLSKSDSTEAQGS